MRDLSELKARAKAATAGPWEQSSQTPCRVDTKDGGISVSWRSNDGTADAKAEANAAYIAAADPTTILSLIEEIERLRGALEPFAKLGAALPENYDAQREAAGPGHPRFWYEIDPADIHAARSALGEG